MSKSSGVVVRELADLMRRSDTKVITMRWPEFYVFCERERMTEKFLNAIYEQAKLNENLIVSWGQNVFLVAYDMNFSPATS